MRTPHDMLCVRADDSCSSTEARKVAPSYWTEATKEDEAPPEMKQSTTTRRITFSEQVTVRTIKHVNDYSEEEIADTWYKKAEYRMMRSDVISTVRKIVQDEYRGDTDDHCIRGLEFRVPSGAKQRRLDKLKTLTAVLDEQDRQFEGSYYDLEALASVYIRCNIARRRLAAQRGELDAEEVSRLSEGKESLTALLYRYKSKIQEKKESISDPINDEQSSDPVNDEPSRDPIKNEQRSRGGVIRRLFTRKR